MAVEVHHYPLPHIPIPDFGRVINAAVGSFRTTIHRAKEVPRPLTYPVKSVLEQVQEAESLRPLSLVEHRWTEELSRYYGEKYERPKDYYSGLAWDTVILSRVGQGANAARQGSTFVYDLLRGGITSCWRDTEEDNEKLAKDLTFMASLKTTPQSSVVPAAA